MITISSFELRDSLNLTYTNTNGETETVQWNDSCIYGTFYWSRDLTEEEASSEASSGGYAVTVYDENGATVSCKAYHTGTPEVYDGNTGERITAGLFGVELPEYLAAGTYTFELMTLVDSVLITDTKMFTVPDDIGTKPE